MAVVLLENQFYSIGPRSHPSICFAAAAAREGRNQCDHMASLFVQFLVICNSENLPKAAKNCLSHYKILPSTK